MALSNSNDFQCPSFPSYLFRPKLFCSILDDAIGPTLRPGHIIEVVGEAGSGKTQFGLHLSARSVVEDTNLQSNTENARARVNRKALYINTEGPFPIGRLRQMIEGMNQPKELMDKIFVENITTIVRGRIIIQWISVVQHYNLQ